MKHIILIIALIATTLHTQHLFAQDSVRHTNMPNTITLGDKGLKLTKEQKWTHTNPTWAAINSYYAMTRIDSNDYVYTIPNLRGFYGVGEDTMIKRICIIFKDSLGTMQTFSKSIQVRQHTGKNSVYLSEAITVFPTVIVDSNESVTIHYHPYNDKLEEKKGDKSITHYKGTLFIYTGVVTDPPYDEPEGKGSDKEGDFDSHYGILDLGFNTIIDNTNYNSAAAKSFLNVPDNQRNSSLFNLRAGKSINVNIYPFMETFYALKRKNQKINISTGIGLQLYNFRYDNPITYTHSPNGVSVYNPLSAVASGTTFKKDKLGFDYLNVPLMVTFKTRLHNNHWLAYGVGITAGYSISKWTKQESGEFGKVKDHNSFGFSDFNSCLTGEIGIAPGIRLYGSYQLTNMFTSGTGMEQHPVSFGFRFFAI